MVRNTGHFGENNEQFERNIKMIAQDLASNSNFEQLLLNKRKARQIDEAKKALEMYHNEELEHMQENFYGADKRYHIARYDFVHKISCVVSPPAPNHIAEFVRQA